MATLEVKFSFWRRLPHRLVGVAHDNQAVAREELQACVAQLQSVKESHRMTEPVDLARIHPLIGMLEEWVRSHGSALSDYWSGDAPSLPPRILEVVGRLRFVMIVELSIESEHALGKARVRATKRASPAMFSTELRMSEIKDKLDHPALFDKFVEHFDACRTPAVLCDAMCLTDHSYVLAQHERLGKLSGTALGLAFYHCDSHSLFASHREVQASIGKSKRQRAKLLAQGAAGAIRDAAPPPAESPEDRVAFLLRKAAMSDFQSLCDNGKFYSAPVRNVAALPSLIDRLSAPAAALPPHLMVTESAGEAGGAVSLGDVVPDMDAAFDGDAAGSSSRVLSRALDSSAGAHSYRRQFFFRVVNAHPARAKRAEALPASDLVAEDVLVSVHGLRDVDRNSRRISVSLDAVADVDADGRRHATCCWQIPGGLSHTELRNHIVEWSCDSLPGPLRLRKFSAPCSSIARSTQHGMYARLWALSRFRRPAPKQQPCCQHCLRCRQRGLCHARQIFRIGPLGV